MKKLALIALLSACTSNTHPRVGEPIERDVAEAALEKWTGGGGFDACRAELDAGLVTVLRAPIYELHAHCPDSDGQAFLMGCALPADDGGVSIVVTESDARLEHELMHWISLCATGNGDAEHRGPVWEIVE